MTEEKNEERESEFLRMERESKGREGWKGGRVGEEVIGFSSQEMRDKKGRGE